MRAISHYEILDKLGAGGMGEVYRARDSKIGRDVAIKVLPAELANDGHYAARLQREARILGSLNHPHIAAIYGLEENAIVMELVQGETLASRLNKGRLPVDLVVRYGSEIAAALSAAHARGIIHRDLKPGNVMLTKSGVKVLDFGLAKVTKADETLTESHVIMGTPAYMAPRTTGRQRLRRSYGYLCARPRTLRNGDGQTPLIRAAVCATVRWYSQSPCSRGSPLS